MLIRVESIPGGRSPPHLPGFEQDGDRWRLDLGYYEMFLEEVTGVEVDAELSARQIKTAQSRLEGCLEGYNRRGNCACDEFDRYEHIDSIETVHELSRFFRVLVAARVEERAHLWT